MEPDQEQASTSNDSTPSDYKSPYSMTEEILREKLLYKDKGRYITQLFAGITGTLREDLVLIQWYHRVLFQPAYPL